MEAVLIVSSSEKGREFLTELLQGCGFTRPVYAGSGGEARRMLLDHAKDLETKEVILTLKTGEGGRTFGSVSSKEISEAAKKQLNLDIDKKKLQLPEPIRVLGVTQVPVKLHPKVTGTLKVWVKEA